MLGKPCSLFRYLKTSLVKLLLVLQKTVFVFCELLGSYTKALLKFFVYLLSSKLSGIIQGTIFSKVNIVKPETYLKLLDDGATIFTQFTFNLYTAYV